MTLPEIPLLFAKSCTENFFGLVPWYKYLNHKIDPVTCDFYRGSKGELNILPTGKETDVVLILAALVDNLLRIAGFLAVVFVIVGAVQYITSQGNPEDTGKAKDTIINALMGLAVCIVAVAFISFIGHRLR